MLQSGWTSVTRVGHLMPMLLLADNKFSLFYAGRIPSVNTSAAKRKEACRTALVLLGKKVPLYLCRSPSALCGQQPARLPAVWAGCSRGLCVGLWLLSHPELGAPALTACLPWHWCLCLWALWQLRPAQRALLSCCSAKLFLCLAFHLTVKLEKWKPLPIFRA